MFQEIILRMIAGGLFVSVFAIVSDVIKPKRFAGLFGAAPSVALATLALTVGKQGSGYAAVETRSMIAGGVAFLIYSCCVCWILIRHSLFAMQATLFLLAVWMLIAFGLWAIFIR